MASDLDEISDPEEVPPPPIAGRIKSPFEMEDAFAGYEIGEELGRGGMGVVYKAVHLKLQRPVALKLILSGVLARRTDRERFLHEARTTAQLEHPNIIQIYDVGERGATPFMALEYVEGGTLADQIDRSPLAEKRAAEVVETLARAVAFAHSKNVVHRDLKPSNVFMSASGPKLGDFGVAKIQEAAGDADGTMTGTPSYMSPEQAAGKAATPSADVYALGAILYECLTGRPPFRAASVAETLKQVLESVPAEPSSLQPNLSRDIDTICMKCLEKEPARRYANAAELADDLRRFQEGRPIVARAIGKPERVWRWMKIHPRDSLLIGAVAGTLIAGTVGVYLQYRQTAYQFTRAENLYVKSELRRIDAETAHGVAEAQRKELEKAVDNMAYLVGVIDLDQLFHFRTLAIDPTLLKPALAANQRFLQEHGRDVEREPEVVAALYRVAMLTRMTGTREEALDAGRKALERQEAFVKANPDVAQYRRDLAASYHNVGWLLHITNHSDEGLAWLTRARRFREEFHDAQPDNLDYRSELAGCLNDIGLAHYMLGEDDANSAAAYQALSAARVHQRAVVQKAAHVFRYRYLLGNHTYNLARVAARWKRSREAVDLAEELVKLHPFDPETKVRGARVLSVVLRSQHPQDERLVRRALVWLQEGVETQHFHTSARARESDFQALWDREDFQALLARNRSLYVDRDIRRSSAERQ